ncbi:MAG: di-trans,poly-cis-decaprenylcistransferase, partial [Clostridia bacterium]|nr:di-trans,poly-cis-decaprenylcistransferase [Clostridia bacterium]
MSPCLFRRADLVCDEHLRHIAFIMDGNRRWARRHALPVSAGHAKGAETFKKVVRWLKDAGLRYMTVYAFSTENWRRSPEEVEALMDLLEGYMDEAEELAEKENASLRFIGDLTRLRPSLRARAEQIQRDSRDHTAFTLQIALSYGGRDEIVHAINALIREGKDAVTEADVSAR